MKYACAVIRFPATHQSVLERIRSADPQVRDLAFGPLAEGYRRRVITICASTGGCLREPLSLPRFAASPRSCLKTLRLDPKGQPFDPVQHEAVTTVAAPELAPGTVAGVILPGYRIGDEVLRPAQVAVAQGT